MAETVITLVNNCDDDHAAKLIVYRSRSPGDDLSPAWQEVEVPAHTSRELALPGEGRYYVGVEDAGPGDLEPGRRDAVEVQGGQQTVTVSGSLASGLRVALG